MNDGIRHTLVGLFVILLGAGTVVISLWLATDQGTHHYRTYVAYFRESVAGLNPLAPVRYQGVEVGRVRDIGLDPDNPGRVRLLLDIEVGVPIVVGTQATLALQGITGLVYVELAGARKDAPPLRATKGGRYPEIPVRPSRLLRLESAVTEALVQLRGLGRDLREVAARVNRILDEPNARALAATLDHVRRLTGFLAEPGLHDDLRLLMRATAEDAEALPGLMADARETLAVARAPLADFGRASRRVADAADRLGRSAQGAGQAWSGFLTRTETRLEPFTDRLEALLDTLQRLAEGLERDPARLIRGAPSLPPGPGEGP